MVTIINTSPLFAANNKSLTPWVSLFNLSKNLTNFDTKSSVEMVLNLASHNRLQQSFIMASCWRNARWLVNDFLPASMFSIFLPSHFLIASLSSHNPPATWLQAWDETLLFWHILKHIGQTVVIKYCANEVLQGINRLIFFFTVYDAYVSIGEDRSRANTFLWSSAGICPLYFAEHFHAR